MWDGHRCVSAACALIYAVGLMRCGCGSVWVNVGEGQEKMVGGKDGQRVRELECKKSEMTASESVM